MNPHFRAFSFVDEITRLDPGISAEGRYTVPEHLQEFPISLAAEAAGQLAAWAAMAALDFTVRPVAGLAGRVDLLSPVRPGAVLELSTTLKTAESDAVEYSGFVRSNGTPIVQLDHCVGPMVPLSEFDDPAAVRGRFELLRAGGAVPGAFDGLPVIPLVRGLGERGNRVAATLEVPAEAAFLRDHFPRRPVFPGTLQMQANLELVTWLAAELSPPKRGRWTVRTLSDVKLRTFIAPSERLQLEARLVDQSESSAIILVETRRQGRLTGTARVGLTPLEEM